jgi:hypothetical protein
MPFLDMLGVGAATVFGVGVGMRAFAPLTMPAIGKAASAGLKATSFAARAGKSAAIGTAKTAPWAVSGATRLAFQTGKFALRHPYMTAGAVGAGAYLATETSPYESPSLSGRLDNTRLSASFNEEQMAAEALNESGIAPMGGIVSGASIRNQRLMESTYGLTQGMWRSRH